MTKHLSNGIEIMQMPSNEAYENINDHISSNSSSDYESGGKYMKKYYKLIVIGTILIIGAVYTLLSQVGIFSDNGHIGIEYITEDSIDISEVALIISLETRIDENQIDVELKDNGHLFITLPIVENDIEQSIIANLDREYGDSIELQSYSTVHPPEWTGNAYLIIVIPLISILIGIIFVAKGIIRIPQNTARETAP